MEPIYPHKPIARRTSLCNLLGLTTKELDHFIENSDDYFRLHKRRIKSDGSERLIYDVKPKLKAVHRRINNQILKQVSYPKYIHGSVKGKDYIGNSKQHTNKKILISEDITNFFPSLTSKVIHEIWTGFFCYPNDIAEILTTLVTYKGTLVQGCCASSYLANLVLWKREGAFALELRNRGFTYTRFVDDVTVSSSEYMQPSDVTEIVGSIYSLFRSIGVSPNRGKHSVMPNSVNQNVHRLNVNSGQVTMPKEKRNNIRAAVHKCEVLYQDGWGGTQEYVDHYNSTIGKVNNLNRTQKTFAEKLIFRLKKIEPLI